MATSGNTIFQLSRDEIINSALRKAGILSEGAVANSTQLSDGAQALNTVIALLQSKGMHLWKRLNYDVTMVDGTTNYTLGIGQTINTAFPIQLLKATMVVSGSSTNIDMEIKSQFDFAHLPSGATGTPVQVMYQPKVNLGVLSVWPTPDSSLASGSVVRITYQVPFDYFTTGTETADFPQEWHLPLIYNLAATLADEFSLPLEDRKILMGKAKDFTEQVLEGGAEQTSIMFQPRRR